MDDDIKCRIIAVSLAVITVSSILSPLFLSSSNSVDCKDIRDYCNSTRNYCDNIQDIDEKNRLENCNDIFIFAICSICAGGISGAIFTFFMYDKCSKLYCKNNDKQENNIEEKPSQIISTSRVSSNEPIIMNIHHQRQSSKIKAVKINV